MLKRLTNTREGAVSLPARLLRRLTVIGCICLLPLALGCSGFPNVPLYQPSVQKDRDREALKQAEMAQQANHVSQDAYVYRIHPTDLLEINVFEYEKMNLVTRVSVGGKVNFPPLGDVQAAGLTQRELESSLNQKLQGSYLKNPNVMVTVREAASQNVTILGEVKTPGQQAIWGETRLLDILAKAGGVTPAAGNIAYLVRGNSGNKPSSNLTPVSRSSQTTSTGATSNTQTIRVSLTGLLERGDKEWNVPVQPGDTLTVPSAGTVYVTGPGITRPGTYPLTFVPRSLCEIIDDAGGLKWGANRNVILARNNPAGKPEFVSINRDRALRESDYDISMQAGDRLIAVSGFWRQTADLLRRGLLTATGTFSPSSDTSIGLGTNALFVK